MLSTARKVYHEWIDQTQHPGLYSQPWWLDAVCDQQGWDVVLCHGKNNEPLAALPFCYTKIRGLKAVITPPMTQWVKALRLNRENEIPYNTLLEALPKHAILDLCIKPSIDAVEYHQAFPLRLKYSYILPSTSDLKDVRSGYNEGLRRNLRQAAEIYDVIESEDTSQLLAFCLETFRQRNLKPPPWLEKLIPRAYETLTTHHAGSLMMATWKGKPIAAVLIAHDAQTSYYLAGGRTGDDAGASAHALLLDRAVGVAASAGRSFDFEGSMHPGIANFFQSFGAAPVAYWHIRRFRGLGHIWSWMH